MSVILVLRRLRQEVHEFQVKLGCIVRTSERERERKREKHNHFEKCSNLSPQKL
jgi:hypothetical protein